MGGTGGTPEMADRARGAAGAEVDSIGRDPSFGMLGFEAEALATASFDCRFCTLRVSDSTFDASFLFSFNILRDMINHVREASDRRTYSSARSSFASISMHLLLSSSSISLFRSSSSATASVRFGCDRRRVSSRWRSVISRLCCAPCRLRLTSEAFADFSDRAKSTCVLSRSCVSEAILRSLQADYERGAQGRIEENTDLSWAWLSKKRRSEIERWNSASRVVISS